jgi:hypothetical protein
MSLESRFQASAKNPLAGSTATGLIQFTDSTARGLGVAGGAAEVARMSDVEQLPLVEKFYARAFGSYAGEPRVVDYYLALLGRGIGQADGYVLFDENDARTVNGGKDNAYTMNVGLDVSRDGQISVGDLVKVMGGQIAAARGERLSAEPVLFGNVAAVGGVADWFPVAALAGVALWFSRKEWMRWFPKGSKR